MKQISTEALVNKMKEETQYLNNKLTDLFELLDKHLEINLDKEGDIGEQLINIEDKLCELIAERRQFKWVEDELGQKIDHLSSHIENARDFAVYQFVIDNDTESFKVSFVSPSIHEILNAADPLDHDTWMELVHPDDVETLAAAHEESFRKTHRYDDVLRMYNPAKQEWRWIHFLANAKNDVDGNPRWVDGILFDVTDQKRAELKTQEYQKQLQAFNQNQTDIEERERRRVAEILHDDVGQELAVALFRMNQIKDGHIYPDTALNEVVTLIEQAIARTRTLTKELCPPALCQMGLTPGIEWLVSQTPAKYGFETRLKVNGNLAVLPEDLGIVVFRIIAELLNNVAKHAAAATAQVEVSLTDEIISLSVSDDGVGFEYSEEFMQESGGFGLFAISERRRSLGGTLDIRSEPGKGTRVNVDLPAGC